MSTSINMETSASYETAGMRFNLCLTTPTDGGQAQHAPGPMIYVWTPAGRVLETYPMPVGVEGPTNCAFGDYDQGTLYVTSGQGHLIRTRDTGRRGWIMWPPVR